MSTRPVQWVSLQDGRSHGCRDARWPKSVACPSSCLWPDSRAADHVVRATHAVAEATGPLLLVLTDFSTNESGKCWALSSLSFPRPRSVGFWMPSRNCDGSEVLPDLQVIKLACLFHIHVLTEGPTPLALLLMTKAAATGATWVSPWASIPLQR